MTVAPFGSWSSPITAADLAAAGHPVDGGRFVGDEVWWAELRPAEAGRIAIRRHGADGPVDVLPPPWNARTRVHEYGGGAWTVTDADQLVFAEFTDQRLYLLDGSTPRPLTPEPSHSCAVRYGDLSVVDGEIWAVRESHAGDGAITRDIAVVPLDGSAADDPSRVRHVVGGSDFLAYPRVSPDRSRIAWIAWNHPQMPWDGTELRVAYLQDGQAVGQPTVLLGGTEESVLQPEWIGSGELYVISDRSGWWNLYRVAADGGDPIPLCPMDADFGGPLWMLGARWYLPRADGTLLTVRTVGTDALAVLDPSTGALMDTDLEDLTTVVLSDLRGDTVLARTGGARVASGIRTLDLASGDVDTVRLSVAALPDAAYLPEARQLTVRGSEREVHVVAYPPRNPEFDGPPGEAPPYVAFVHGGPTAHVAPSLNPVFAFFTSRGIGVVDVNYGGSTGYGREYRNRLRGQWGVVDVEDVVTAVRGLAELGLADAGRLAIEGGSAGGWTVLAALTTSDVFACGTSYYGVAELDRFVEETHDFESRYIDGLIGPLPEAAALYASRAPLENVDALDCPVLLLQGLDDPIVPPAQAERFRDALVRKGIPHAYIAYEGESHGFRRAETQISARNAELSFYGQVLGFTPPGIPELELWRPE
ncbi:S9 family peptidase [Rhodococcus triatomae]|uniref:Dipeptidyl aminopeptidase/acylaminoacyl peptidase n=1 Tax=Rhodococcus triatomae TaxID=300028 RepID=A0A1G8PR70_9NOCA|nr:prolyl oligopeptidase family serine peptidase [Rhodococcus triatomae]QNG20170.1 S9 family peptidase [Rhodococcus triatomae]QNG23914.1 S9 family peptidase [Rhodococcus triatomae]SDI94756.1 Dipeptidyl aminopeptidase/acylaminoacyl peptidase [Rhodococcus triatomae]